MPRTLTAVEHDDLMQIRDRLLTSLTNAMQQRPRRQETAESGEPGWMVYERYVMTVAVSVERAHRGLPTGTVPQQVRDWEDHAAGHIDYAAKFAYYCARIAYGLDGEET